MNQRWIKRKPRPAPATAPEVIECTGAELISVLAKLRRMGRTASEPVHAGPNCWRVYPGNASGGFKLDPHGQEDRSYSFNRFSDGMHGRMKLDY